MRELTEYQKSAFMAEAYKQAKHSPDPSNQNGALVVTPDGIIVSGGHNGFGQVSYTPEMLADRNQKLAFIEHAERAALFNAACCTSTSRLIMVCPWASCTDCARAIARMGISEVVVHTARMETTPERWKQSVADGHHVLRSYGVDITYFDSALEGLDKDFTIVANGVEWSPVLGSTVAQALTE